MILGVISDTHGLLRREVPAHLAGVDLIVHAGDIGTLAVLDALSEIAPTVAVRGNVDVGPAFTAIPDTDVVCVGEAGEIELFVLHDIAQLKFDAKRAGYRAVIYGHSHRASIEERGGVLFLNPGAAGPKRFNLSPSLARVEVRGQALDVSLITL